MRLIRKGAEPPLLLGYRKTQGARYDGLPADAKIELRKALVRDQHGLCMLLHAACRGERGA